MKSVDIDETWWSTASKVTCIATDAQDNERRTVGGHPSSRSYITMTAFKDIQDDAEIEEGRTYSMKNFILTTARAEAVVAMEAARERQSALLRSQERAITCSSSVDRGAKPPHCRP